MGSEAPDRQALFAYWRVAQKSGCVWGFDIGGANLKVACLQRSQGEFTTHGRAFALWRQPEDLAANLRLLTATLPRPTQIAITMTGEIADCFVDKASGVASIVEHCEAAFAELGVPIRYYAATAGDDANWWRTADSALDDWTLVAASNWHAVARVWGDFLTAQRQTPGLIADLGSTTLDLTIVSPKRRLNAATDWQRIQSGQLIYTGARRSPLAMILPQVNYHGRSLPLAQELFATIHDAYLLTGLAAEDLENTATADGRPATRRHAAQRIAKLFCSDATELPDDLLWQVAQQAQEKHQQQIAAAMSRCATAGPPPDWVLVLGEGERPLVESVQQTTWYSHGQSIWLGSRCLGPEISRVMPAAAIALLAP